MSFGAAGTPLPDTARRVLLYAAGVYYIEPPDAGEIAAEAAVPKTVITNATYLEAHRTATSLRSKKGGSATRVAV